MSFPSSFPLNRKYTPTECPIVHRSEKYNFRHIFKPQSVKFVEIQVESFQIILVLDFSVKQCVSIERSMANSMLYCVCSMNVLPFYDFSTNFNTIVFCMYLYVVLEAASVHMNFQRNFYSTGLYLCSAQWTEFKGKPQTAYSMNFNFNFKMKWKWNCRSSTQLCAGEILNKYAWFCCIFKLENDTCRMWKLAIYTNRVIRIHVKSDVIRCSDRTERCSSVVTPYEMDIKNSSFHNVTWKTAV